MTDPISQLTLAELDEGSRHLKADLVWCITDNGNPLRWRAMAHAAYLVARRADPSAQLDTYLAMNAEQIGELLSPDTTEEATHPTQTPAFE